MRGNWGVFVLLLAVIGLACNDKPRRMLRQPDVQSYDLPAFGLLKDPPVYPEDKYTGPAKQKNPQVPGSLGGIGGGPNGPGGALGPNGPGRY